VGHLGWNRYETLFGQSYCRVWETAFAALARFFVLLPNVNEFIQAPFWLLSRFVFLFVYVWMRGTLRVSATTN